MGSLFAEKMKDQKDKIVNNSQEEFLSRRLEVQDWGTLDYGEALLRQKTLVEERIRDSSPDRLILVEHPPVVTIGRSGKPDDLLVSEEILLQRGATIEMADRGGKATYHGPGQIVVYPIIGLEEKDIDIYLRKLHDAVVRVLEIYGLSPSLQEGKPGIWVGTAKIASVGIALRRWVTYHGIALNVNTDLQAFNLIVPCGHRGGEVTSMRKELGFTLDMEAVKKQLIKAFSMEFDYSRVFGFERNSFRHPAWLIRTAVNPSLIEQMEKRLSEWNLTTVCQNALCPNLGECFSKGTATFMILGSICTRGCRFCAVDSGVPEKVDPAEPERVAQAVKSLGLKYAVITSVTRDDLPDGGSGHFVRTVENIRYLCPSVRVEVLIPDFNGSLHPMKEICDVRPDMLNHNVETVRRLYPFVRPGARYTRSLQILNYAAERGLPVKTGLMLGLGETDGEIHETLADLRESGCDYLTMGQYLAPTDGHFPVVRYVTPEEFKEYAAMARSIGFKGVASGSFVRSSYRAEEMFKTGCSIS
jgi:lipoic acid synthetase